METIHMKREDKELLLKDICARQPYGVKVQYEDSVFDIDYISVLYEEVKLNIFDNYTVGISEIKPYLRPMSSMTEKEKAELSNIVEKSDSEMDDTTMKNGFIIGIALGSSAVINYLLSKHFDFRGLIEKGLAIAVTEDNNPYKL